MQQPLKAAVSSANQPNHPSHASDGLPFLSQEIDESLTEFDFEHFTQEAAAAPFSQEPTCDEEVPLSTLRVNGARMLRLGFLIANRNYKDIAWPNSTAHLHAWS